MISIIQFGPSTAKRILAEISNALFDPGEISGKTIFIDGTKIEACANRYTFVWKKAVTKNQTKLLIKIADFVAECEQLSYIKPANYEKSKNDIGKMENREYDIESDNYICKNKKNRVADHIRHSKTKTGYISEKTICESLLKKNICRGIMEKMGYIPEILMEKKKCVLYTEILKTIQVKIYRSYFGW